MSNTSANSMPARAIPTGEAAVVRPIIVFGSRPGVGATTVATVARAALMTGASLPRLLTVTVTDGLDGPLPDIHAETVDFDPAGDTGSAFIRVAETLAEGNVVVDCAAGAVGRLFAEADAVKVGHLIAKGGGVTAVVVVGPSPSSAQRAGDQIAWLTERGSALGVSHVAVVRMDNVGRKAAWDSAAHGALRGRLARSKVGIAEITHGDLNLLTEFGVEMLLASKSADIAAKLSVSEIEALARVTRLKVWLGSSADGLRAAGVIPAKAAAKAA